MYILDKNQLCFLRSRVFFLFLLPFVSLFPSSSSLMVPCKPPVICMNFPVYIVTYIYISCTYAYIYMYVCRIFFFFYSVIYGSIYLGKIDVFINTEFSNPQAWYIPPWNYLNMCMSVWLCQLFSPWNSVLLWFQWHHPHSFPLLTLWPFIFICSLFFFFFPPGYLLLFSRVKCLLDIATFAFQFY